MRLWWIGDGAVGKKRERELERAGRRERVALERLGSGWIADLRGDRGKYLKKKMREGIGTE